MGRQSFLIFVSDKAFRAVKGLMCTAGWELETQYWSVATTIT
jgi:hypothetical protein